MNEPKPQPKPSPIKSVTLMGMDVRGFGGLVRVEFDSGSRYRDAYVRFSWFASSDGSAVFKACAYDTPQFERFFASIFPARGGFTFFAEGPSYEHILLALGCKPDDAYRVGCEISALGLKRTGTSGMTYQAHRRDFIVIAKPEPTPAPDSHTIATPKGTDMQIQLKNEHAEAIVKMIQNEIAATHNHIANALMRGDELYANTGLTGIQYARQTLLPMLGEQRLMLSAFNCSMANQG